MPSARSIWRPELGQRQDGNHPSGQVTVSPLPGLRLPWEHDLPRGWGWEEHSRRQGTQCRAPGSKSHFHQPFKEGSQVRALSRELLFTSYLQSWGCRPCSQAQGCTPPGNTFPVLPKEGVAGNQASGTPGGWDKSVFSMKYLMVLAMGGPLEYVPLCFIFACVPTRICETAYPFCAVGLGGRTCEVPPSGSVMDTVAQRHQSPGNQRQQGRERQ